MLFYTSYTLYSVVECDRVWYIEPLLQCGTVWNFVLHCGTVWYIVALVHCGTVWYGVVHCTTVTVWYDVVLCGTLYHWYGVVLCAKLYHCLNSVVQCGTLYHWYGVAHSAECHTGCGKKQSGEDSKLFSASSVTSSSSTTFNLEALKAVY